MRHSTPDDRVGRHAARHHGLIDRAAAKRCGLSDRQIGQRVATGRWMRIAPGVYRVAGAPITAPQVAYAAALAAGPGAVVGGLTALSLFGVGSSPMRPALTVPPTASARSQLAVVRRSPVAAQDRTKVGPIPCTTPARALVEAAALVDAVRLADLVDEVIDRGLASPSTIVGALRRAPVGHGRTGAGRLRDALEPWLTGIRPGSPAEVRLLRRLDEWGFAPPERQHEVRLPDGRHARIDVAWPGSRLGLEYDGRAHHTPRDLAADVAREEALRSLGWWIGRVDRHDLAPSSTRIRDELLVRLGAVAA